MSTFKDKNAERRKTNSVTSSLKKSNNKLQVIPSSEEKYKNQFKKRKYSCDRNKCLNDDKNL